MFQYLWGVIDSIIDQQDIDAVSLHIGESLDKSIFVDKTMEFVKS